MIKELELKFNKLSQLKMLDSKINSIIDYCSKIKDNKINSHITLVYKDDKLKKSYQELEKEMYETYGVTTTSYINPYKLLMDMELSEDETLRICASLLELLNKKKKQLEDEFIK